MKKIVMLAIIGMILNFFACKDDQGNEFNPLPILSLLGNSTLTVTATYNGTPVTGIDPADGTGKIFVYLYDSLGLNTRYPEPLYSGSTDNAVTIGNQATITITGIRSGEYYVLVFYDYAGGGQNDDNYHDRYVLYNGTGYTSGASKYSISGETTLNVGTFGDDYELGDGSVYATTATYILTVNATYTGTLSSDASATQLMYVYLYNTLGTSTRNPGLPYKTASSAAVVASGVEQSIAVTDVAPGNYYVLVFYDSSKGTNIDSVDDPYVFFTDTPYIANAQQIVFVGDTTLPDVAFGETNTLQDGAAFMTTSDSGTLTVTSTYNGAIPPDDADRGTMNIFVYLYSVLGTGTRDQYLPIYTGVSASPVTTVGGTATIDVTGVIPGSYYVLVFYDYRQGGSNDDNRYDRYVLYNGVRYTSTASTLLINTGSNPLTLDINDDTWQFQSQTRFMTP